MPICIHPQFVIILTGKVLPSHPEHRIAIGTRGTSAPTMPLSLPSIQVETASCKPTGLSKRSANSKSLVIAERSGHFFSVFFHGPATTISSTFRCGNVKYQLSIIKSLATRNKCLVRDILFNIHQRNASGGWTKFISMLLPHLMNLPLYSVLYAGCGIYTTECMANIPSPIIIRIRQTNNSIDNQTKDNSSPFQCHTARLASTARKSMNKHPVLTLQIISRAVIRPRPTISASLLSPAQIFMHGPETIPGGIRVQKCSDSFPSATNGKIHREGKGTVS
ncbi:uncharacterized protein ARB_04344 [Trichophyton benhamiae CBS 112371]|uniref:Uncharacterized protein n=1 Tax=Arthroderma benhamiae (strain ATCC MYA-4681 / CBS 112371) TaxID=663331 RepID=D4AJ95_ARTBC|nr:uncharacterized protein ARB_04344 [Trichophyton benhamiae CBS 112371]EFE36818.1 hypothetical protein ARB_04344 [Trichophyton benhamiae CBS 112371]